MTDGDHSRPGGEHCTFPATLFLVLGCLVGGCAGGGQGCLDGLESVSGTELLDVGDQFGEVEGDPFRYIFPTYAEMRSIMPSSPEDVIILGDRWQVIEEPREYGFNTWSLGLLESDECTVRLVLVPGANRIPGRDEPWHVGAWEFHGVDDQERMPSGSIRSTPPEPTDPEFRSDPTSSTGGDPQPPR